MPKNCPTAWRRPAFCPGIRPGTSPGVTGEIGAFQVKGQSSGAPFEETVHGIVLAHDSLPVLSLDRHGAFRRAGGGRLVPSRVPSWTGSRRAKAVAFFAGAARETDPVTMGSVMELALALQTEKEARVFIFTGNLKVAGDGLERLFRQTKTAGVFWAKFTKNPSHGGARMKPETWSITFEDEISRQPFSLCPDVISSPPTTGRPRRSFWPPRPCSGCTSGADDRPQTDNVRRAVVRTNRAGVWVAGGARRRQFESDDTADADNAVLAIRAALDGPAAPGDWPRPKWQAGVLRAVSHLLSGVPPRRRRI